MSPGIRLTVIGCAGSFPGPESPASCYLIEAPHEGRTFRLLLDLGSGALGDLQRVCDLREIDAIALSHLHADHCFDMSGLYVFSKYHPEGPMARIPVHAPPGTADYLAQAYGIVEPVGMTEQFAFEDWRDGGTVQIGPFDVTAARVDHPGHAYGLRVVSEAGAIAYSGDTGPTDALVALAAEVDLFLCEASFVERCTNPPHLHLTGAEAGDFATQAGVGRLLVTHIPAWTDRAQVESDVKTTWQGPYDLVTAGSTYEL